ncbi:Pesticidal crystal cry1Ag [Gossypium australe]|uniref:Pesticidal crystal cry1Ag n=1 Tax=Gossypium australe TaxID=47621 RepID=A0A5B6UPQ9_9ROSI|nr:Pesticidal crystal cry1Ag [Gossypium australe]
MGSSSKAVMAAPIRSGAMKWGGLGFGDDDEDEGKGNDGVGVENDGNYWESQHQLLEATLRRTSSLESRIRNAAKEALNDGRGPGNVCGCGKSMAESCRVCVMREVCCRLQNAGFNTAVCSSKWRSAAHIPSGKTCMGAQVFGCHRGIKKGGSRVIIELNLRAQFEIARASDDYNRLVQRLPQIYVGKVERLNNLIKILCLAAKKCMKEKKLHMGPWRKHSYMQVKWLRFCERNTSTETLPAPVGCSVRSSKPRASLWTVDLLGTTLSNLCCAAV